MPTSFDDKNDIGNPQTSIGFIVPGEVVEAATQELIAAILGPKGHTFLKEACESAFANASKNMLSTLRPTHGGSSITESSTDRAIEQNDVFFADTGNVDRLVQKVTPMQSVAVDGPNGLDQLLSMARAHRSASAAIAGYDLTDAFGKWLRSQRLLRGWSQADLAARVGTSPNQVSLIENSEGKRGPSLDLVGRFLRVFDVELRFTKIGGQL